jgi:hypothetical protein
MRYKTETTSEQLILQVKSTFSSILIRRIQLLTYWDRKVWHGPSTICAVAKVTAALLQAAVKM